MCVCMHVCVYACMCVCVAKPVAVELRCHATALIYIKNCILMLLKLDKDVYI